MKSINAKLTDNLRSDGLFKRILFTERFDFVEIGLIYALKDDIFGGITSQHMNMVWGIDFSF